MLDWSEEAYTKPTFDPSTPPSAHTYTTTCMTQPIPQRYLTPALPLSPLRSSRPPPPLAPHHQEEARRSLNAGYLAREGGPLRGAATASASLIKYYGRAGEYLIKLCTA
jgi:hypothetical protein